MSFDIAPLQHSELNDFIRVWWNAFEPAAVDQVLPMIYPRGLQEDLVARLRKRITDGTDGFTGEYCFCAKAPDTGEIVGVSWWTTLTKPNANDDETAAKKQVDAALDKKKTGPAVEGMNQQLGDAFYTALLDAELQTIKQKRVPYLGLQVLAVLPEYSRKGVGTLLLEDGLKRVDDLGVWTFLVAAMTGKGLYEKSGFEVVGELPFDARKYGGSHEGKHWIMLRPAVKS